MGNFSRSTFDKIKHYVGVRLQQGVPLVDADWNEQEDIRKYELRAFLKWFVGNGVPRGNDGFRVLPLAGSGLNTIVLTSNKSDTDRSSLVIVRENSTAAEALGFGPHNYSASRTGSSPAQLTGNASEPFALVHGMSLVISTDGLSEETVTFETDNFDNIGKAKASEVITVINNAMSNLKASVGEGNDFEIKGGDGTTGGAGRCLVEGWDVINESNLKYTEQPLYNNDALADAWGVNPVQPLTIPSTDRKDLVYLHVWEREINAQDDENLIHEAIGVETCVRTKREWAVRVAEGTEELPSSPPDHVFYPLAFLNRKAEDKAIREEHIEDLRLTGLSMLSYYDILQILKDAFGESYTLDHDGEPNLKVSMREAINALLKEELPTLPDIQITTDTSDDLNPFVLKDLNGDIWVFWESGIWESRRIGNWDIFYKRYRQADGCWDEEDTQLTTHPSYDEHPKALLDKNGDIWVFWVSDRSGNYNIWCKRYRHADGCWDKEDTQLTTDSSYNTYPNALLDKNGDIWVFWVSDRSGNYNIWCKRYRHADRCWDKEDTQLTIDSSYNTYPNSLLDKNGDIWVFWASYRSGNFYIWYKRYRHADGNWDDDTQLTIDSSYNHYLSALLDKNGDIWVFWVSWGSVNYNIWCKRYRHADGNWDDDTQLTTESSFNIINFTPNALLDKNGDIWVFWALKSRNWHILYKRYRYADDRWHGDRNLTNDTPVWSGSLCLLPIEDINGVIWVFWCSERSGNYDIWCKKIIPSI